jgi:hypothetical protein
LRFFCSFFYYSRRLYLKSNHESPETKKEMINAIANPNWLVSMPLMRFIPNNDAMSVGNIMMILTDVSVRITVFMLLLMILEYVSMVDSKISETQDDKHPSGTRFFDLNNKK